MRRCLILILCLVLIFLGSLNESSAKKEAETKRADKEQERAERAEQDTRIAIQRAETAESRLQRAEKRFSHNTFKQYGELIRKGYTDEQAWEIINMFN